MNRQQRREALRRMFRDQLGIDLPEHIPPRDLVIVDDNGKEIERIHLPGDSDPEPEQAEQE